MQELKGIPSSAIKLIAVYLNLGVEPKVAREAAKIVIQARSGVTHDRTQAERTKMKIACLQMKNEKLRFELGLNEKGMQALNKVKEAHKD